MHEYCDATRGVLHLGQRDVGIQTGEGCCDLGKRGEADLRESTPQVVPGGVGVSLGMVASSSGISRRFGDAF